MQGMWEHIRLQVFSTTYFRHVSGSVSKYLSALQYSVIYWFQSAWLLYLLRIVTNQAETLTVCY